MTIGCRLRVVDRPGQRGYSLLELMVAVALTGLLGMVLASFEARLFRQIREVTPRQDASTDLSMAVRSLTRDARRARAYRWEGPSRVEFSWPDGTRIVWSKEGPAVVREQADPSGTPVRRRVFAGVHAIERSGGSPGLFLATLSSDGLSPRFLAGALRNAS